ncbi:hypothetical protein D3C81_2255870 [compost metagenome]
MDLLLQDREQNGCTTVLVTHDPEEALYLSDTIHVLYGGPLALIKQIDIALPRAERIAHPEKLLPYKQALQP